MKPLLVGHTEENQPLLLTEDDLATHVHGIGASRTGKSKLLEWIARELFRNRQGFCLIDPHGFLYEDIVSWLAYLDVKREVVLWNPSERSRIVGFNPFRRGVGDIGAQADRRVKATIKAWGQANTDQTPRLERWLRCIYYTLIEQGLPLEVVRYLLFFKERDIRRRLTAGIQSAVIRNEWEELDALVRAKDFAEQIESSRSRLFRFVFSGQTRRIMGLDTNNIDLEDVIENGKVLLVNLQPSGDFSDESARLMGTLLLNDIWEIGMRRRRTRGEPNPFFILIDEFQKFLTPDVPAMLDQAAKYGLHLVLCHQHLSQLREMDPQAYSAVMTNARVKLVFGGLTHEDARTLVDQIFPGQIDLNRVKFLIEQTKFWPVYTRDEVRSSGVGTGHAVGSASAVTWSPTAQEWAPTGSSTEIDSSSTHEGTADIPIFYPVPFREVSSITTYSLEETLREFADRLMEQYQRHFMVRRPGRPTVAAITPFLTSRHVRPERVRAYIEGRLQGFLTPGDVDRALEAVHERLALPETTGELVPVPSDEDLFE